MITRKVDDDDDGVVSALPQVFCEILSGGNDETDQDTFCNWATKYQWQ